MRFFCFIIKVFRSYDYWDILISVGAFALILAMILKMILFPYGVFNFGESNIYTEGIVSKTGFQNINPLFVDYNEADREVSNLVFSGLMKYDPNKRAIVDDMGVLTINEDKTEYSIQLREGLKWHDGEPLTVEDVYYTFHDVIMDPTFPNQILKANFAGVEVEQTDESTILFKLESPNIFFITNLTIGILPKHILKNTSPANILQDNFNKMPIGSGPYMVTDAVEVFPTGRMQITLTRNPYYYGELSEIEFFRFISYPSMERLILDINSVNAVIKVPGKYLTDFENSDRFMLMSYELPQYTAVFMNMESEILQEKNVRLALQKSVYKDDLIEQFNDKKPVDTPLMALNQEDWIYKPDVEEAQGALKDAGFSYGEDDTEHVGIRYDEDGKALELRFLVRLYDQGTTQFEESMKVVKFLQESWENVGFDINVEFLLDDEFEEQIMKRDYDLLLVGQSLGYNLDTYSYWHSSQADPRGQNLSNYKSFRVDSLIEDIRAVFNKEKRERELNELAEQIKEDIPAIFLYRPVYFYATDGKVSGVSMDGVVFPSDRFTNLGLWRFER
ncbi:hypothetical protein GF354_00960 [Candidatus Peregrinibacteria bacterium]|nr:hypothetical protein [Candidatus Peregrinibacteria bacterium]